MNIKSEVPSHLLEQSLQGTAARQYLGNLWNTAFNADILNIQVFVSFYQYVYYFIESLLKIQPAVLRQ